MTNEEKRFSLDYQYANEAWANETFTEIPGNYLSMYTNVTLADFLRSMCVGDVMTFQQFSSEAKLTLTVRRTK